MGKPTFRWKSKEKKFNFKSSETSIYVVFHSIFKTFHQTSNALRHWSSFCRKKHFFFCECQFKQKGKNLCWSLSIFFSSSREFINAYHKNQQIITKRNKKNSRKHEYKWFAFVYFYDCITNITNSICFSFYYFRCWYCCCLWFRRTVHSPLFKHKTLLLNLSTIKLY